MTPGSILETRLSRLIPVLAIALALSACAYRYAGEEAPDRHYNEKNREDAQVVKVTEEDPAIQTSSEEKAKDPESPCGLETFEVHRFDPTTRITRTIDCRTRDVVKVERTPLGQTRLTTLRERGHPEESWYLLVDPEGLRSNYVNNVELMKLRQEFDLAFDGKDRREELMIYILEEDLD